MNSKTLPRLTAAIALTAGIALTAAIPAQASHGDKGREVQNNGQCSLGADWKLKAKADDGRLEVEAEVDTNQVGQTFNWQFTDNGNPAAEGSSTTAGRSGSFSVERRIDNLAGKDKIVFTATNPGNGETCKGTVRF